MSHVAILDNNNAKHIRFFLLVLSVYLFFQKVFFEPSLVRTGHLLPFGKAYLVAKNKNSLARETSYSVKKLHIFRKLILERALQSLKDHCRHTSQFGTATTGQSLWFTKFEQQNYM